MQGGRSWAQVVRAAMGDNFWDVQKIWAKTKDSSIALGNVGNVVDQETVASPPSTEQEGDFGEKLLKILADRGSFDSYELSKDLGKDHQVLVGAIKSIQSVGEVKISG